MYLCILKSIKNMQDSKNISAYRQSLKDRILEVAMKAFASHGIKAVKMDDIAQMIGISKRTLYEVYANKELLVYEGIKKHKEIHDLQMKQMSKESVNVMDLILKIYRKQVEQYRQTCPEFFSDISRYPKALKYLRENEANDMRQFIEFLKRGVSEGYFRADLNVNMVALMFSAIATYINYHQLYKEYTLEQIYANFVLVSLRGFCTSLGTSTLDNMFAEEIK